MLTYASLDTAVELDALESVLIDVARALQLTTSQYRDAQQRYESLAAYVDRDKSLLAGKLLKTYPSGSFAIYSAIRSSVSRNQHDVDAVLELSDETSTDPALVLDALYGSIKAGSGTFYNNMSVFKNSRCVTVKYADGVTVDLMPVIPMDGLDDGRCLLFHYKPETGEKHLKPVNPSGFAKKFNEQIAISERFASHFGSRRLLMEGDGYVRSMLAEDAALELLEKGAEVVPIPDDVDLDQRSPRVVALQLLKRFRDVRFRKVNHQGRRKPPSIVTAAMALDAGMMRDNLFDELQNVVTSIRDRLASALVWSIRPEVYNPAFSRDQFTDRWPENHISGGWKSDVGLWHADLNDFLERLAALRSAGSDADRIKSIVEGLFGESVSQKVLSGFYDGRYKLRHSGRTGMTSTGRTGSSIVTGSPAASIILPLRSNTNMGD